MKMTIVPGGTATPVTVVDFTCDPSPRIITFDPAAPGTIVFTGGVVSAAQLAPIEIYCRECGRGNAANGMCFRCHPIPVERPR